MYHQHVEIV